jgi:hypothetical protein
VRRPRSRRETRVSSLPPTRAARAHTRARLHRASGCTAQPSTPPLAGQQSVRPLQGRACGVVCATHACDAMQLSSAGTKPRVCAVYPPVSFHRRCIGCEDEDGGRSQQHVAAFAPVSRVLFVRASPAHVDAAGRRSLSRSARADTISLIVLARRHAALALVAAPVLAAALSSPAQLLQSTLRSTSVVLRRPAGGCLRPHTHGGNGPCGVASVYARAAATLQRLRCPQCMESQLSPACTRQQRRKR